MSISSKCSFPAGLFSLKRWGLLLAFAVCFSAASRAQLVVDCTGASLGAFTTINAALSSAGPGTSILVTGPCNEDVVLWGQTNLFIGAWYGQPATLNGRISIGGSHGIYLYGLNVTSTNNNGLYFSSTDGIILDTVSSNGNAGFGLQIAGASQAAIFSPSTFDNNVQGGINITENSIVTMGAWNGLGNDISNNHGTGVYLSQASFNTYGHTTIANNAAGSGSLGFGVDMRGGAKAQFGAISGPNIIQGNQNGGVSLQETAKISFWNGGSQNIIQGNGPVGVVAGFGSQVTFYTDVEVAGHTGPGLDLYASSQAYLFGANYIHNNGTSGDSRSAAIRVDGNSEVFLRGGTVSLNNGPAILALVNSSADFTGATFSSNSGGIIACDSSAFAVSDLATGNSTAPGFGCRTPHTLGNRSLTKAPPALPDWSALKAIQAKYRALATR